jgi:ankyrin repeat protein
MKTTQHSERGRSISLKMVLRGLLLATAAVLQGCMTTGTPRIHLAAAQGKLDVVQTEAKRGANINQDYQTFGTPLHQAALFNQTNVALWLVQNGAAIDGLPNSGTTPLFNALLKGQGDIAALLITNGANVNFSTPMGKTPLFVSMGTNSPEVIKLLLSYGAKVNATNSDGMSPLHAELLQRGDSNVVSALLDAGADINRPDNDGYTPLHLAAQGAHTGLVKLFLAKGANVSALARTNVTPLHLAFYQNLEPNPTAQALIDAGATTNAVEWVPACSAGMFWTFAANAEKRGDKALARDYYERAASYFDRGAADFRKQSRSSRGRGFLTLLGQGFIGGATASAYSSGNIYMAAHTANPDLQASRADPKSLLKDASRQGDVADFLTTYAKECRRLAAQLQ